MPYSEKQRRAAYAELNRRKNGTPKATKPVKGRPFATASMAELLDFTSGPIKKKKKKGKKRS